MKLSTKAVRGAFDPKKEVFKSILPPIYQTATYFKNKKYDYSRTNNPTREILENTIAKLENAKFGLSFSSGMAAEHAIISLLKSNDHVIVEEDVYGGTYRLFEKVMKSFNLSFSYVDCCDIEKIKENIKENTKMIWIECPTNPLMKIPDIRKISKICKENNLILVVDSTLASPYFLNPLDLNADIVIHSTTKYISGHHNLIGGAIALNNSEIYEKLKFLQNAIGAVPSPFDCWLTLIGIKTLHLRMERHNENSKSVAKFLSENKRVKKVYHPSLKDNKYHKIAKKQMRGFGGIVSFEINNVKRFLKKLKLIYIAESFGGVESMITHPASMTHKSIPKKERERRGINDNLLRLSVGIEDIEDIIEDINRAIS